MMQGALGAIGEGLIELGCDEGDVLDGLRCGFGGDAANTAVMASQLGAKTRLCGRVGADTLGRRLLTFWGQVGIDLAAVHVDTSAPTGLVSTSAARTGRTVLTITAAARPAANFPPGTYRKRFWTAWSAFITRA